MIDPKDIFDISKTQISNKVLCEITLDEKEYDERTFTETSKYFEIPGILLFFVPQFNDYTQIILNYSIHLMKSPIMTVEKGITTIQYEPNSAIVTKDYKSDEMNMGLLIRLLQGRIKYIKDPSILLNFLHDILNTVDLVHLELIVSNMFRDVDNPVNKCRLNGNYNNSVILGQQRQPIVDSWQSSIAYRNIDRAITEGLVKQRESEQNPIENVLNEDFKRL